MSENSGIYIKPDSQKTIYQKLVFDLSLSALNKSQSISPKDTWTNLVYLEWKQGTDRERNGWMERMRLSETEVMML